jgi:hypothetical protein
MKGNRSGYNRDLAASVLITAVYTSDAAAAAKYGVSIRTLLNYRRRLATDDSLAQVFNTRKALLDKEWAQDFIAPMRKGAQFLLEAFESCRTDKNYIKNPVVIQAVAEAVRLCADVVLTSKAIDAQFSDTHQPANQLPQEVPSPISVEYPC